MTPESPTAQSGPSAEETLHAAICNAVILLNNGEEFAPRVSAVLRTALAEYIPTPTPTTPPAGARDADYRALVAKLYAILVEYPDGVLPEAQVEASLLALRAFYEAHPDAATLGALTGKADGVHVHQWAMDEAHPSVEACQSCPAVRERYATQPAPEPHDGRGSWISEVFKPLPKSEAKALRDVGAPGFEQPAPVAGGLNEEDAFMAWAIPEFHDPQAERFDHIDGKPANRLGLTWEYNDNAIQSAWAAWMERAMLAARPDGEGFDFAAHLQRQREWSERTFGPGPRTAGVTDHIRKELAEIEAAPTDSSEWIDVVILALDGAWRSGASPSEIIAAIVAKQTKNEGRNWPDWRTADPNKAIEHDRAGER